MPSMHEVDYEILGDDMQFVKIELDPGEAAIGEAGAMMYMEDGIEVQTIFGDGTQPKAGIMDALLGAGKRLLVGESLFMTVFHNNGTGKRKVAFAAPYPGKIIAIHLAQIGGELIAQKDSFLVAAKGVRSPKSADPSRPLLRSCAQAVSFPIVSITPPRSCGCAFASLRLKRSSLGCSSRRT